jgi:phosphoribosyl-ATP pyrophosphohydrolase/phosphoribosyl-AMP cyclohydrolase
VPQAVSYALDPMSQPPARAELPIHFDVNGLVPVIVQDHLTGEVRMFAFATPEAVRNTLDTGRATFWSRSRAELWEKGRTSGNTIHVLRVLVDCDADCLIYSSEPCGQTCHTGALSCFFQTLEPATADAAGQPQARDVPQATDAPQTMLGALEAALEARKHSTAGASYTKSLYDRGPVAIGAKIREEAGELACAIEGETDERVVREAADAVYHVLVGLRLRGIPFRQLLAELARRFGRSGHDEKASR